MKKHIETAKNSLCRLCRADCKDKYTLGKQAVHQYCYFYRKECDPSPNTPQRTPEDALKRIRENKLKQGAKSYAKKM